VLHKFDLDKNPLDGIVKERTEAMEERLKKYGIKY
jgi:hypothetical protein